MAKRCIMKSIKSMKSIITKIVNVSIFRLPSTAHKLLATRFISCDSYLFPRAWHRLHVFPRLAPVACFSRAWYWLHVFPALGTGVQWLHVFPVLGNG